MFKFVANNLSNHLPDLLKLGLQSVAVDPLLLEVDVAAVVKVRGLRNWQCGLGSSLFAIEFEDVETDNVLKFDKNGVVYLW